ncbi:MAG: hypothetical protein FWD64_07470, partial [Acidobacteriaceae bacterium]|nr:hypothetical protein [Acidobacteriaceae bacterium]
YGDNWYFSPQWEIQEPYFIHKAHYVYKPAPVGMMRKIVDSKGNYLNRLMWATTGFDLDKVKVDTQGRYMLDLTDIPALTDEDWTPPLNTLKWGVRFYYSDAMSGGDYWKGAGKQWEKDTNSFIDSAKQLSPAVAELVAPTDTQEQKARKIYAAVMKLDNTDFSRKRSESELKAENLKDAKNAADVWNQKSGTGDQLALLYVGLARAAGLKAWPGVVANRAYTIFNVQYLSSRQLNDNIAIVEIDGKKVYLDPGQAMCPFGQMAWWHYLASGFGGSEKGAAFISVPANNYTDAVVNRVAQVELDPTGMITGSISVVMTGPEALRWRQLALRNDADEVKKRFNESLRGDMPDGVEAELNHFLGMDNPDSNLLAIVDISGNMGTVTGKRVFLPGSFFQSRGKHPFVSEQKRFAPIDVQYARLDTDSVEYSIPAGYSVESMPQATDHNWENIAVMKIVSEQKKDTVTVSRALAHNFILLKPEAYTGLHDFYLKVATADQQQVVLTRDGDAKGN